MAVINCSKWEQINKMILLINSRSSLTEMRQAVLDQLSGFIEQNQSLFLLAAISNDRPNFFAPVSAGIHDEYVQSYLQYFALMHSFFDQGEDGSAFISCDAETLRKNYLNSDVFYIDWLLPQQIEYVLSAKLSRNGIAYGLINLYRTKENPPFSETDKQVFKIIVEHLSLKLSLLYPCGIQVRNRIENADILNKTYGLTFRELDVCNLIYIGYNSNEIGRKLNISEHTVKKHTRSILTKLNAKNRTNLIRVLHDLNLSV